jgi:hypothetical protein
MRSWARDKVFVPLRRFMMADVIAEFTRLEAEIAAVQAQLRALEDLRTIAPAIERALVTLGIHADDSHESSR